MKNEPLISVVLPAYNAEKYILEALNSIFNQTYSNFELLLINDGSTDSTPQVISLINDPRLKIINNPKNLGLVDSLNVGLKHAKGEFIARMDADDIAYPNRFKVQVDYLLKHKNIDIVSSNYEVFGTEEGTYKLESNQEAVSIVLHYKNTLCHPCTMFRREKITGLNLRYQKPHLYTEDWVLWFNCIKNGLKIANIDATLLKYRLEGQNNTTTHRKTIEYRTKLVLEIIQNTMFGSFTEKSLDLHWSISTGDVSNVKPKELTQFYNDFQQKLIELKHSPKLVKSLLQKQKDKSFYKFCDQSFSNGLQFMIKSRLFSLKNFRYLFSKVK